MSLPPTRALLAGGLAALLLPAFALAANGIPPRKGGWWEVTMTNQQGVQKTHVCSDTATEAAYSANLAKMAKASGCDEKASRTATGWTRTSTCRSGGQVDSVSQYTLTGALDSGYRSEMSMKSSAFGDIHSVTVAKLLGACPAGRKPGQRVTADGKVEPYPPPLPSFAK